MLSVIFGWMPTFQDSIEKNDWWNTHLLIMLFILITRNQMCWRDLYQGYWRRFQYGELVSNFVNFPIINIHRLEVILIQIQLVDTLSEERMSNETLMRFHLTTLSLVYYLYRILMTDDYWLSLIYNCRNIGFK